MPHGCGKGGTYVLVGQVVHLLRFLGCIESQLLGGGQKRGGQGGNHGVLRERLAVALVALYVDAGRLSRLLVVGGLVLALVAVLQVVNDAVPGGSHGVGWMCGGVV